MNPNGNSMDYITEEQMENWHCSIKRDHGNVKKHILKTPVLFSSHSQTETLNSTGEDGMLDFQIKFFSKTNINSYLINHRVPKREKEITLSLPI